jgi:hypothetical protein
MKDERKFVPKYLAFFQAGGSDTPEGSIKPEPFTRPDSGGRDLRRLKPFARL